MEKSYVPTLAEYAEVIEELTINPGKALPVKFQKAHDDAMKRAELYRVARALEAEFAGLGG